MQVEVDHNIAARAREYCEPLAVSTTSFLTVGRLGPAHHQGKHRVLILKRLPHVLTRNLVLTLMGTYLSP